MKGEPPSQKNILQGEKTKKLTRFLANHKVSVCLSACRSTNNAGGRNRTGTGIKYPWDFKSQASTYSATPATIFKVIIRDLNQENWSQMFYNHHFRLYAAAKPKSRKKMLINI
jgi:hypothetical protein